MLVKVKIQDNKQRFVKNGGMHLLDKFVRINETLEIELLDKQLFILDSEEFKYWFEKVEEKDDLICVYPDGDKDNAVCFVATEKHTISDLRSYCKGMDYKDYTQLSKGELIEAINNGVLEKR